MFGFIKKIFGTKQDRDMASYDSKVALINELGPGLKNLSHDALREKTTEFRDQIADYLSNIDAEIKKINDSALEESDFNRKEELFKELDELKKDRDKALEEVLEDILPEAFAVVRETARRFTENEIIEVRATEHDRNLAANPAKDFISIEGDTAVYKNSWTAAGGEVTWAMVHYDVQLVGGMVLHEGKVAEQQTGEGKTLVATLATYLNGLSGQGVHMVTVNDYLARRDCEWVGPIYEFLMLTVDCIDRYRPHSEDRKKAYRADVTFGTNNEFGFDYLRDNMVISPTELVQGKHHFCIIDEVDSVLIDDARTPLIISGPVTRGAEEQEFVTLNPHVKRLLDEQRKIASTFLAEAKQLVGEGNKDIEEGGAGMALLRAHRAMPKYKPLIKFLSEPGIKVLLQKTENFYMQENNKRMPQVDVPLLFTIDEKNRSVELSEKGTDFLSRFTNDEDFFVMPDIALELMKIESDETLEGEEKIEKKEKLGADFSVKSRRLHSISQLLKAYTLFERDVEYIVVDEDVKIVDEQTGRVMDGRRYSDGLHQALEAKEEVKIGDITQTYATVTLQNYFRMYHKLSGMTGTAETEAKELWDIYKLDVVIVPTNRPIVRDDREDLVYKTEREKYNAVIDDVMALTSAGRPVLVGTTSVETSELLSRLLHARGLDHNVLNAKQHQREAEIVAEAGLPGKVTIATNMAGRGTDIKLTEEVKRSGGLAIIGTERHDSRRVDRQLRGRAGRQGDPGSSQFYVSLEDNLMRLFQSDRIASLMDKMGHQDGEVIQHSMVTKSIERAQRKVEENNFGIRKRLLEYDDVMNIQREAIYTKRRNALFGDRLSIDLAAAFDAVTVDLVYNHKTGGNFEKFRFDSLRTIGVDPEMDEAFFTKSSQLEVLEKFQQQVFSGYNRKSKAIGEELLPIIRNVHATHGDRYKRITIPFTDGASKMNVSADMEKALASEGKTIMRDVEKVSALALIDDTWKEHLRSMDDLKESSQSASFEQKDPLVIYKMEAFGLFENLISHINENVSSFLLKGGLVLPEQQAPAPQAAPERKIDLSKLKTNQEQEATESQKAAQRAGSSAGQAEAKQRRRSSPIVKQKTVGRNEPCPCGSGKKFKQCHGKN